MMKNRGKIFFISHESSLTGAPVLLLNLIKLWVQNGDASAKLILFRGGPLEMEFRKLTEVVVLKPTGYLANKNIMDRFLDYLQFRYRLWKVIGQIRESDIVLSNTVANGNLIRKIKYRKKVKVLSYIHELESVIEYFNVKKDAQFTFEKSDFFLSPCKAVTDNLVARHKIDPDKIFHLPYYFPQDTAVTPANDPLKRNDFFQKLKIPEGKFYVVGMGTVTHRKGVDLFFEVCRNVVPIDKTICFVWMGAFDDEVLKASLMEQARQAEILENFVLTGKIERDPGVLGFFDLFFLSSREDPYPLVVIEAAFNKLPSLYFKGSGGIEALINEDAGWGVSDFNVSAMAGKILQLKSDRTLISRAGNLAYTKAMALHGDEKFITEKFMNILAGINFVS
ncbi:MAG: glycosyltransferase [Terrimonas sp.]|nr:glycosyltransferase [Terrimonas sp.]